MREWTAPLKEAYDVVVVGAGAIGLTAALSAADSGARVAVVEKADFLGGTAALSGGMLWIPCNRYMAQIPVADSADDALRYLKAVTDGRTSVDRLSMLVRRGDEMLEFVWKHAGLDFLAMRNFPDYHPEWAGAHGGGRSLEPHPFDIARLGALRESLRPDRRPPFTMTEYEEWRSFTRFPWEELEERAAKGIVARGRALVAPLIEACAGVGVALVTGAAAERLVVDRDAVKGLQIRGASPLRTDAVILACGGFEWSSEMVSNFLPGPVTIACSPPHNTGDGIRMAGKIGAAIGNMREAWWGPMVAIPEDMVDSTPTGTLLRFERTGPGSVIINRDGKRFVNEAHNYNDMTKAFHRFDPGSYSLSNLPAYLIFDQKHLRDYGFLSHRAGYETPAWLTVAGTLSGLADALGIPAESLEVTIEEFNRNARQGRDPDFHRGESAYDRYWGDPNAAHPALGPVDTAPFYAIEVVSGVIGTKGGVVTDASGQVLDPFGQPIAGLFAAGNTTSHPMGPGYPGAGATLGPGMTVAYIAGRAAAA